MNWVSSNKEYYTAKRIKRWTIDYKLSSNNDKNGNTTIASSTNTYAFNRSNFIIGGRTVKLDKATKQNVMRILSCVYNNDKITLDKLLAEGIDINISDADGRTALFYATSEGNHEYVKLLLEKGANVYCKDNSGYTPLHFASQNFYVAIAKILIEYGAVIDALDVNGNSPLSDAVFYSEGRGELINLLLSLGADRDLKNNYGVSPYELAESIANYEIKKFFD